MNTNSRKIRLQRTVFALFMLVLAGCATNPVTGKKELRLMSTAQEIQQGTQYYAPMRQGQGGDLAVDPELQAYVSAVGQRLAAVSDLDLPYEFTVLNSSVPNAWALPGGKIAINRGLLTELRSEAELAAVLGHEVVHAAASHSAQQMTRGALLQGGMLATAIATRKKDNSNLWMMGANIGAQLINQRYGRGAELESDLYGMQYMKAAGYDPQGAVELQQTFVRLSEGRRTDFISGLFASHPPSTQRVAANRQTAARLGAGGERGIEQYQRAMRKTLAAKPAYDVYDEGRKALAENKLDTARSKGLQAIKLFPAEGHFYSLLGDVSLKRKNYDQASDYYTQAIRKNDNFFYYYLQRGLVAEREGKDLQAQSDLEASLKLLPTGPAYNALGNIARRGNRLDEAKEYYRAASGAGGELGIEAEASLLELDLSSNPGKYVQTRTGLGPRGFLVIQVANATKVPMKQIGLTIQYIDSDGRTRTVRRALNGTLAGGKTSQIGTEIGPFTATNQYKVTVNNAAVAR